MIYFFQVNLTTETLNKNIKRYHVKKEGSIVYSIVLWENIKKYILDDNYNGVWIESEQ